MHVSFYFHHSASRIFITSLTLSRCIGSTTVYVVLLIVHLYYEVGYSIVLANQYLSVLTLILPSIVDLSRDPIQYNSLISLILCYFLTSPSDIQSYLHYTILSPRQKPLPTHTPTVIWPVYRNSIRGFSSIVMFICSLVS